LGKYFLLLILNADYSLRFIQLPVLSGDRQWRRLIDTSLPAGEDFCEAGREVPLDPADCYLANPRSTAVLLGQ
jgi:hypothetical protein